MCDEKRIDRWPSNQPQPCLFAQIFLNAGFGCKGNGVIPQDRPKGCVMVDVHKKCL